MYRSTFRLLIRRQGRAIVAIGLLCGIVVGVGLWGLAASRRTASTFERYLSSAQASDLSVNLNSQDRAFTLPEAVEIIAEASTFDGVVASATYVGLESMTLERDLEDNASFMEFVGSLDGRFLTQDRVAVTQGRLPDLDRADEVFMNEVGATSRGIEIGDTERVLVADLAEMEEGIVDENGMPRVVGQFDVEVVGIGTFPDDVLDDEYDQLGRILLTPAATERWLEEAGAYVWHGMRLTSPGDVDRVLADYQELTGDGVFLSTLVTADQAADVQRAVRPLVAGLILFGLASLLTAVGVGVVALMRLTRNHPELSALRAFGVRPRQLVLISCAPAAVSAVLAVVVAAITAIALSPLAPVGSIRSIEPAKGIDLDALVVGGGVALVGLVLLASAVISAARSTRPRVAAPPSGRSPWAARLGANLPAHAALGVRRGIGTGTASGAPTRATLIGTALAAIAVLAALTFGASLSALSDHPARYGWSTDVALTAGSGYDTIVTNKLERLARPDERIRGLTIAGFSDAEINGEFVPAMATRIVDGRSQITLLHGRLPGDGDEVALGGRTADRLGVAPGDEVAGPEGPLQLVGIVAFPAIGPATSAHPGMGEGALFTLDALEEHGAQPSVVLVDLVDGIDGDAVAQEMAEELRLAAQAGFMEGYGLLRPAELDGAEDANGTVRAIAAVVGVATVVGLATVVMASVRARRRELAVLRVLGFTAGDLRRTVRWQAGSLAVVAIVLGTPIGVAAGRTVWQAFAETLGVDPSPTVPLLAVVAVVVLTPVLAVVAALPAARQASQMSVAPALRPE
jgi:ABC-type antimicrobial peptide transport system permease subunit